MYINEWQKVRFSLINHFVKSVRIRSFSGPYFLAFGLNTDLKNSEYGQFLCSEWFTKNYQLDYHPYLIIIIITIIFFNVINTIIVIIVIIIQNIIIIIVMIIAIITIKIITSIWNIII